MRMQLLEIKNHRFVCPVCRQRMTQSTEVNTSAKNLPVWCKTCKAVHLVDIVGGQGFVTKRIQ